MSFSIEIIRSLDRIDWSFPGAGSQAGSIHSTHWFPGNYIPQIPSHLIQILSNPGDIVFDPFGGSGTTAIEANKLSRNAISSDLVSACVFIANRKISAYQCIIDEDIKFDLLSDLTWTTFCETEKTGLNNEGANPELFQWYSERTIRQLRYIWNKIESISYPSKLIYELVFSDVLFSCASTKNSKTATGKTRKHHWGWVADNVRPKTPNDHDAIALFTQRLFELPVNTRQETSKNILCQSIQQDSRKLALADSSIDLVVTSPPYIGVTDYTRANRMLYMWKGEQFDRDKENEIGARYKRARINLQREYLNDMRITWNEVARVLKPSGYCAVVLGESRKFPGTAENSLVDLGKSLSLIWGPVKRHMTRRRVFDQKANDSFELVSVFQKL